MFQVCKRWKQVLRAHVRRIKLRHWINFNNPSYETVVTSRLTTLVLNKEYILGCEDIQHLCYFLPQLEVVSLAVYHPVYYRNIVINLPRIHSLTMYLNNRYLGGDYSRYFEYKTNVMALWRKRLRTLTIAQFDSDIYLPISRLVKGSNITVLRLTDSRQHISSHTLNHIMHHIGHQLERFEIHANMSYTQLGLLLKRCANLKIPSNVIHIYDFTNNFSRTKLFTILPPIWVTNRKRKISELE